MLSSGMKISRLIRCFKIDAFLVFTLSSESKQELYSISAKKDLDGIIMLLVRHATYDPKSN